MQRVFSSLTNLAAGQYLQPTPFTLPTGFSVATPLPMAFGANGIVEQDQISGSVFSDQPGLLLFQHSDNPGNNLMWEAIGAFSNIPKVLLSIPIVIVRKPFWRFIYQNTGTATTTTFELDLNGFNTAPPAVDQYGNIRAAVVEYMYSS